MDTAATIKTAALCALLSAGWSPVRADALPTYEPERYCRLLANGVGGPPSIWDDCVERERLALGRLRLAWDGVPTLVASRCDGIARSIGGSYDILEGCVRKELGSLPEPAGGMS